MGKNWLIRTKSNHILGPVSKEKVLELFQNGSIKPDDEVCTGNGYWFYVRESDLIDRFLLGKEAQSFNPISEAKDVLTSTNKSDGPEPTRDDITLVGNLNLSKLKESAAPAVSKPQSTGTQAQTTMKTSIELDGKKKVKSESVVKQSDIDTASPKSSSKQGYLKYLWIFGFVILFLAIYFRKTILKSFLDNQTSFRNIPSFIVPDAHAQDDANSTKKKSS